MFGFLTPDVTDEQNPLLNYAAAERFSSSLPLDNPLETLRALCEALETLVDRPDSDIDQLNVLLSLDLRTTRLREQLLTNSVERDLRSWPPDSTIWQSVVELSCAFRRAYEHFLRHMRGKNSSKAWIERAPAVLVHLFRHRQVENLSSLFRYEQLGPTRWREMHEAYQYAYSRTLAKRLVQIGHREGAADAGSTLEHQYIHILLLQLMNNGQFTPREVLWARRWLSVWCMELSLEPAATDGHARTTDEGFVVDPAGAEGLRRPLTDPPKSCWYLDPTPLAELIDDEIKSLRDAGTDAHDSRPVVRTARLAVLAKLKIIFSPKPVRIERRGERKVSTLMTARVFAGISSTIRALHDEWQVSVAATGLPVSSADDNTITAVGGLWRAAAASPGNGVQPAAISNSETGGSFQNVWRVKDQSESGTLLRGRVDDPFRLIPGTLIIFRDRDDPYWTVAVVRRLKKLLRSNVEIGVEHIGRRPQGVTIAAESGRSSQGSRSTPVAREPFAALYLRESSGYPKIPIKTLLLPAREFEPGRQLTLLSTTMCYTLRLKEPLEPQAEFVWTAFEIIGKQAPAALNRG